MKSEEVKLKDLETTSLNQLKNDNTNKINYNKITINDEEIKTNIQPFIHVRQISLLSESVINYFFMGICFFIYGCYGLEWFKIAEEENKSFYLGYFLISGICLYIIGIINWYEGKELIFLIDIILSFFFICLFLKNQYLGNIYNYLGTYDNDKLQGIFYILFFCFILIIGICSKEKGIIYVIDYAILFVTYVFLFAYKFFKNDMFKKIDCYMFIVCGGIYWITGLFKFCNSLMDSTIIIYEPSD